MQTLKRHKRDEHAIQTESTSPPLKKKKIVSEDKNKQSKEMDIDESHDSVKDLSFKLEDMDIDPSNNENESKSIMMDEKVKSKEKKVEEEEKLRMKKANSKETRKKKDEKLKVETTKKLTKQRKLMQLIFLPIR